MVNDDNDIVQGEYITYSSGNEASSAFRNDASYPLRYFAVSGTRSAADAADKSFVGNHQYAFFSYTERSYTALRQDYEGSLVETPLLIGLDGIPTPFDSSNAATVEKYKTFFSVYGSHIIHTVNYGARYPLVR